MRASGYPKVILIHDFIHPSPSANVVSVIKMAEALARFARVELWVPKEKTQKMKWTELEEKYDLSSRITIKKISGMYRQAAFFPIQALLRYVFKLSFYGHCFNKLKSENNSVIVYTREPEAVIVADCLSRFFQKKMKIIFEIHQQPAHPYDKIVCNLAYRLADRLIAISDGLKRRLSRYEKKLRIIPLGVETRWINREKKSLFRKSQSQTILYIGSSLPWKGVDTLLAAAEKDNDPKHAYKIVGSKQRESMRNVRFFYRKARNQLRKIYQKADCLVLPNSGRYQISRDFTCPLKLFEYMAAGKPVIAADLPSIREIVSDQEVWFFHPDNPQSLLQVINKVLKLPRSERGKKVRAAFKLVKQYTWEKRAQKILQLANQP